MTAKTAGTPTMVKTPGTEGMSTTAERPTTACMQK